MVFTLCVQVGFVIYPKHSRWYTVDQTFFYLLLMVSINATALITIERST